MTKENSSPTLRASLLCGAIIALCFLWTSTGYISWLYHLMDFSAPISVDLHTEVIGYLFQALGIFLFSLMLRSRQELILRKSIFIGSIGIDFLLIVLAVMCKSILTVLIFGYLMNLFHGIVAGFYLFMLTTEVAPQHRPLVFGCGYAISCVASWLLSLANDASFLRSEYALISYGIFICITIGILLSGKSLFNTWQIVYTNEPISPAYVLLGGITVLLICLTRGIGFYFPAADLSQDFRLEFSRIFYSVGLIIAGFVCNRSRKFAAISCLLALVFPFAMIALTNQVNASLVVWSLGYAFFGLLAVFRVVIFTDLACIRKEYLYVAAYGLMFGRIGDALGTLTGIGFGQKPLPLVLISSVCFVLSFIVFFVFYNKLYMPAPERAITLEEQMEELILRHEISPREAEVFRLIIAGNTNGEIAKQLFISENTVKFHIRNILKKTNCANRTELGALLK